MQDSPIFGAIDVMEAAGRSGVLLCDFVPVRLSLGKTTTCTLCMFCTASACAVKLASSVLCLVVTALVLLFYSNAVDHISVDGSGQMHSAHSPRLRGINSKDIAHSTESKYIY